MSRPEAISQTVYVDTIPGWNTVVVVIVGLYARPYRQPDLSGSLAPARSVTSRRWQVSRESRVIPPEPFHFHFQQSQQYTLTALQHSTLTAPQNNVAKVTRPTLQTTAKVIGSQSYQTWRTRYV